MFWPAYPDVPAKLCRELLRIPKQNAGALTLREALILHIVLTVQAPPALGEIGRLVDAPQPSVSRCVSRLGRMGLVRYVPGKRGRKHIVPTLKARALI